MILDLNSIIPIDKPKTAADGAETILSLALLPANIKRLVSIEVHPKVLLKGNDRNSKSITKWPALTGMPSD